LNRIPIFYISQSENPLGAFELLHDAGSYLNSKDKYGRSFFIYMIAFNCKNIKEIIKHCVKAGLHIKKEKSFSLALRSGVALLDDLLSSNINLNINCISEGEYLRIYTEHSETIDYIREQIKSTRSFAGKSIEGITSQYKKHIKHIHQRFCTKTARLLHLCQLIQDYDRKKFDSFSSLLNHIDFDIRLKTKNGIDFIHAHSIISEIYTNENLDYAIKVPDRLTIK
jgi:hypothetical protein